MASSKQAPSSEQQVRLMIWYVPRSTSTALAKCLSYVEDTKVFFEVFANVTVLQDAEKGRRGAPHTLADTPQQGLSAFLEGAAEVSQETPAGTEACPDSYRGVQEQLEGAHPGKRFIFGKDVAHNMVERLEFIPRGYRHLFLVRHPLRVFPSMKRALLPLAAKGVSLEEFHLDQLSWFPRGFCFREALELFEQVRKELDPDAIVVDSDDLLRDPRGILSAVFQDLGLPFDEKLLHWEAGDAVIKEWVVPARILQGGMFGRFYQKAMDSTCFQMATALPDRMSLSPDLLRLVDASLPHYEKMYSQRLTADVS